LAFGLGLGLAILVVLLVTRWLFDAFKEVVRHNDTALPALAAKQRPQLPRDLRKIPAPLLQENESADLTRLRQREEKQLNSYGWVDTNAGVVHIPIAEAMRLLADPKSAAAHGIRVEAPQKKEGR
jgi:hypothetical protein